MAKSNTLGLIFSENPEVNLGALMNYRSLAAVPVGGRYRIIDFMLSCMVNAGITNVGVTTAAKHRSLRDHLGSGKAWDLSRKETGLFILSPFENSDLNSRNMGGIDYINNASSFLRRSKQEYVMLCDCNTICNIDFEDISNKHIESGADITLVYTEVGKLDSKDVKRHILLGIDEDNNVSDIQIYNKRKK